MSEHRLQIEPRQGPRQDDERYGCPADKGLLVGADTDALFRYGRQTHLNAVLPAVGDAVPASLTTTYHQR